MNQKRNSNRYALIVGASKGIGRAVAITMAQNGYSCILVARNKRGLRTTKKQCDAYTESLTIKADITIDQKNLISTVERETSKISFLWLGAAHDNLSPLKELDTLEIQKIIATGFTSQVELINRLYPLLRRGKAQVVTAGSDWFWGEEHNYLGPSVFQATKLALTSFGSLFQKEAIKDGIKVTNLKMGDTQSGAGYSVTDSSKHISEIGDAMVTLADIGEAISFITSRKTGLVTDLEIIPSSPNY